MKRFFLISVITALFGVCANAQVGVGMRDSRYVNVQYKFLKNYAVKLEHSVYSEKFKSQYVRLYASYERTIGLFELKAEPYFGMTYSNSYTNGGISVEAAVRPLKWLGVNAAVIPHGDSDLGYATCYNAGLDFWCSRHIAITGAFTNRPEYRMPEKCIRAGAKIVSGKLWAHPELSVPTEGNVKSVRVLVSLGYEF